MLKRIVGGWGNPYPILNSVGQRWPRRSKLHIKSAVTIVEYPSRMQGLTHPFNPEPPATSSLCSKLVAFCFGPPPWLTELFPIKPVRHSALLPLQLSTSISCEESLHVGKVISRVLLLGQEALFDAFQVGKAVVGIPAQTLGLSNFIMTDKESKVS